VKGVLFKWGGVGLVIVIAAAVFFSMISAEEKLTGGEFVIKLTEAVGLEHKVPFDATTVDYVNLLKEEGFIFPAGFDPEKTITPEEKAELLSQVLRIRDLEKERSQVEVYRNKAVIKKIEGQVMVRREGTADWQPAELDMKLGEGDYIKTGPQSSTSLRVGVAGRIEIKENSEMRLKDLKTQANGKAENILLYLAMGEMEVDVRFIDKDTTFKTQTVTTIAAVRGTIYIITVSPTDGKTQVR